MGPSNPLITEVREAQELLVDFTELKLSPSIIRDRKVYRDALLEGKGVVEMNNSQAKAEIQLLGQEIFQEVTE
jgi:chromosome partitioning protein